MGRAPGALLDQRLGPARRPDAKGLPALVGPGVRLAVTEGFEPSVGCPTLAFEASTFGRSDTSPWTTLTNGGAWLQLGSAAVAEEVQQQGGALVGEDPAG